MALIPFGPRRYAAVAAAGLLVAAAPAAATTARVAALGGGGDYLRDERTVLRWYASGVDHAQLAIFDFGRFDTGGGGRPWSDRLGGQAGGVHLQPDPDGDWGTAHAYFHAEAVQAAPSQVHADYPGGCFSLGWARRFGGWDLGLGFRGTTYAETSVEQGGSAAGREDYRHDWGVGVRRRFAGGGGLELAGEIRNVLFRMTDTQRELAEPGRNDNRSFGLRARAVLVPADGLTLVPLLDYTRDVHTIYSLQIDDVADLDAWLLRAGLGCRFAREQGQHLVFSCEVRDGRETHVGRGNLYRSHDRMHRQWWSLHVRAAVESELTGWLTARFSLQYRRIDDEEKAGWTNDEPAGAATDARRVVDVPLGLGLAVRHGRFGLDISYNDQSPLSTPNVPDANAPREAANFAILSLRCAY